MTRWRTAAAFAGCLLMALCTGCGSIHVGTTTHTHYYQNRMTTDDAADGLAARWMKFCKNMIPEDADPLEGFKWPDE
jgi:hypothetical protein